MRTFFLTLAAALAALSPRAGRADVVGPLHGVVGPLHFERYELKNGLHVILHEDHSMPIVTVVTWYQVGSKDERVHRTGFAHLFEHLMFKGSAHIPDGKMDVLLEEAGGWSNAFTSSDMTVYQDVASANFLATELWIEGDRLAGLTDTLDQAKLDNQRDVVRNERRQTNENAPYGMAGILLHEKLWPANHGYHWDTIGYHEDLVAATVDDVKQFFKAYYVPNNATLVIAGDFKPEDAKALVDRYLGWIPRGPEPDRPRWDKPAPIAAPVVFSATDKVQVPRVYLQWRGPEAFSADEPALTLLGEVLGGGKSSRLYKRLVYKERVAQDVRAGFDGEVLGGTFQVVVTAKPGVSGEALAAAVGEELGKLRDSPVADAELEQAKNAHEARFLHGLESLVQRAEQLAGYDALAHDPDYFDKDIARFRGVTAADVQRVARRWLEPRGQVVLTINPEKK